MCDSMLLAPDLPAFRYALYCRSHLLDLTDTPAEPIALYRDEAMARTLGVHLWPSTFIVVDLAGGERS